MNDPKTFCIWHKHRNRVAVNLGGQRLEGMTRKEADQIMDLIHPDIREMVEIRETSTLPN